MFMFRRLRTWGNVVELMPRGGAPPSRLLWLRLLLKNWRALDVPFLGSLASLIALLLAIFPPSPTSPRYIFGTGVLLILVLATVLMSVRRQYQRRKLYQQAAHPFHMLTDHLVNRLDPDVLQALQAKPYLIGSQDKGTLNRILYETLNDLCDLFKKLVEPCTHGSYNTYCATAVRPSFRMSAIHGC